MNRTEIINRVIASRGFSSYLEIGVRDIQLNFAHIQCRTKVGVDIDPSVVGIEHHVSSDEYFKHEFPKFGCIFIDGDHSAEASYRDIHGALRHLLPGGVVVIHDCLPPSEWHQRALTDFQVNEAWNGQVWESVLRIFETCSYLCRIVDCDFGCGFIDTAVRRPSRLLSLPLELDYARDFSHLDHYKITPERFQQLFQVE